MSEQRRNMDAVVGGGALGLSSYGALKNLSDLAQKRSATKLRNRALKVGVGAAVAAPLLLSRNRFVKNDLPGPRLSETQLKEMVRRGDVLLTGRPASMSTRKERAIAIGSGTPNVYHGSQVAGVNEQTKNIFVHDHGPVGTALSRKLDTSKNVVTVLRPKDVEAGERSLANMEKRQKLMAEAYQGLKERGVPERVIDRNLKSFYSPKKAILGQAVAGLRLSKKSTEASLAMKLKKMDDLGIEMPRILDDAANHLKLHGTLPKGTPIKTLDAICTTALASAGAPIGKGTHASRAMASDFLRAAGTGADKAYEAVGHYIPEGERTAGKWATRLSKALHPAGAAAAGLGAGYLGTKALGRSKPHILARNPALLAAGLGAGAIAALRSGKGRD